MKKGDLIFVYGTLRRGERADLAKQARNFGVDYIGVDRINGRLYHLGSFPGLKRDQTEEFTAGAPVVTGEVFRIRDNSVAALMDAYESYRPDDPEHGLYNRCQVQTEEGRTAWVYTYNHPVIEEQRIPGGDWCRNRDASVMTRRLRA
jgi:gamma-glutamylcyclotransferase (GGCT)/AIG2-like uncharacterized protein YtfP